MNSQLQVSLNRIRAFFLVLGIILALTGCVANVEPSTGIPSVTFTPLPTMIITPSPSPSQTTAPPTQTPLTPIPTLPPAEKELYLLDLIKSNGGCELPCFLGIQPGVSTWEEIRKIEGPLYFRERYLPDDKVSIYLHTYIEKRVENLEVGFLGSGNTIEQITVDARTYLPDDPYGYFPAFAEAMRRYSLPNVLSEFGAPSKILLQVQGQVELDAGTQAEILLLYDNLGFVVHYFFLNVVTQDQETFALRACPNYEHIKFIRLYLQAPTNKASLERMIGDQNDYYLNTWLQPLEKISTLSVEDFYNLFVDPNENACLEAP